MPEWKGHRLYVNLGASQVRRRVKGFGHGVRKVQATGRHQSVIIHTATGQHLRELQSLFSDVLTTDVEDLLQAPIENLRNLGPKSALWLKEAGIGTIAELMRLGPVLAYRIVRQRQPSVSVNLLWALAAGAADRDWRDLTDEEKKRLVDEVGDL